MAKTSTRAQSPWPTLGLWAFLRRELAFTPERWQATLRLTLACTAATVPIMMFKLHIPLLTMIVMYLLTNNWLRVLDTAKRSQVDQRIRQQFHAIVPLLDAFKTEQ
jgi:hypothetical protein